MNLDPAKLLVILVIGLLVLGPERLPKVARQLGHFWQEFTSARDRLVQDIKDQVPDLPSPRSFRSILVDPLTSSDTTIHEEATFQGSDLTPVDDQRSVTAWSAHQRRARDTSSPSPSDLVDPTMN